jgi:hypothetical protein
LNFGLLEDRLTLEFSSLTVAMRKDPHEDVPGSYRSVFVSCFAADGSASIFLDPLKDVQEVLPEGVPNEGRIIQARQQVREMAQDALASLYEVAPGARRVINRSAGDAVFSTFGLKLVFAGGTTGKGIVFNHAPSARPS